MSEHGNNPVASTESIFAEAFNAASNNSEAGWDSSPETNETVELQDTDVTSGNDTELELTEENNSEPEVQEADSSEPTETSEEGLSESVKEITVKGKDGKRRNIKVDFSDTDRMTKYVQKAANAVRLQSERDALQAQVAKLTEAQTALDQLQTLVDQGGIEGLIDHLTADQGGIKAWMDQKIARHELRVNASEDELARLDAEEKNAELQRRLDLIERQQAEREERLQSESSQAALNKLQSEINPIYFKYTFDGKLGDSVAEQRHNRAMFRDVTDTLDKLQEEGVKITPAVIEREFRSYATPLLKGVNRRVRQNTKKAIDRKKTEATQNAQQQVRKGYANNDSIDAAMNSKNWTQSLADLWVKGKLR